MNHSLNAYFATSYPSHKPFSVKPFPKTMYSTQTSSGRFVHINGIPIQVDDAFLPHPSGNSVGYTTPGPNFRSSATLKTVDGTSFVCSKPINAQLPNNITKLQHVVVQDASTCQLECMEAGANGCNVFQFQPSKYALNCSFGVASNFISSLASTSDPSSVAGYCIPTRDAVSNIYVPSFFH